MKPKKTIINSNPLTITNIGKGDTVDRFNQALSDVLQNIKDEQTDLKKREIIIRVTITPGPDRDQADIDVSVFSKLVPRPKYSSSIVIGVGITGEVEAHESLPVEAEDEDNSFEDEI